LPSKRKPSNCRIARPDARYDHKVIDLVEAASGGDKAVPELPQVKKLELVRGAGLEFGVFDVHPA